MFLNESKILTHLASENNISYIIGIDEVGRGAGAGPVVVCASFWKVSTPQKRVKPKWLALIDDSKALTADQREVIFSFVCNDFKTSAEEFFPCFHETHIDSPITYLNLLKPTRICKLSPNELKSIKFQKKEFFECTNFALAAASNNEIDQINIWNGIQLAINRALFKLENQLKVAENINPFDNAVLCIDGKLAIKTSIDFVHIPQVTLINGDALLKTIGFSSIIAKVCRDKYMSKLSKEFPGIGFEQHKGYLTKKHQLNLQEFGHTRIHRQSFLKNIITNM